MPDDGRLSLNQITIRDSSLVDAIALCRDAGVPAIGVWRDKAAEVGVEEAAALIRDAGLTVSSLCRGGFFTETDAEARAGRARDNRAAVDEAVALGTDVLVLVCGAMSDVGLDASREMIGEGIAALAPFAQERGVRLAIEPFHPMLCPERSVIVSLAQALDIAEEHPPEVVGVTVDTYHVWWDPYVYRDIARAGRRIMSLQVCDWLVPLPDPALGRGMPGDGIIELRRLREAADAAGYDGPVEVEIFNQAIWDEDAAAVVRRVCSTYAAHVAP